MINYELKHIDKENKSYKLPETMKVFISHHIGKDEKLAGILQLSLKKRGITGYIAQRKQEYELLIIDKIKNQIENSDYLVAIITKHGLKSASVHEEIGYAIASDVKVILMVEEFVDEQGVLIHGKESYYFESRFFEIESDDISKYILSKGIPKKSKNSKVKQTKEKDQYQQYSPAQKMRKLTNDSINAFKEHQFKHKIITVKKDDERGYNLPDKLKINIFENKKRKERFFFFPHDELKNKYQILEINSIVRYFIFENLSLTDKWKNMCFLLIHGTVTKQRISNNYDELHQEEYRTNQNTTILLDFPVIYHGLGQGGLTRSRRYWNYSSSIPKFFAHKTKSKDDIVAKIGFIEDFIDEHENIFKNVPKLKKFEWDYQIIPKEIDRQKEEKRREKRNKKLGIGKAKRLRARPRMYSRRGGYGGNPAYVGTPKE